MDTSMTRGDIRRRVLAIAGYETNENQASQVAEQLNVFIEEAAEKAFVEAFWAPRTTTEDRTLGVDQTVLNYPTNYAGAAIVSVDIWREDYGAFCPLQRAPLPTYLQDDLLAAEDPAQYEADRSTPLYYDFRDQIHIWPRNDVSRKVRITYENSGTFANDEAIAPSDGLMILYWACSRFFAFQDRMQESLMFAQSYEDRKASLARKQARGLVGDTTLNHQLRMGGCNVNPYLSWGTWPSSL